MSWQDVTLGDLMRSGTAKFRQIRRAVNAYSPIKVELDVKAVGNLWNAVSPFIFGPILFFLGDGVRKELPESAELEEVPAIAPVNGGQLMKYIRRKPWYKRTQQVAAVLQEAFEGGIRKYDHFLAMVRDVTGKGCSRRAIANFIKERKLAGEW